MIEAGVTAIGGSSAASPFLLLAACGLAVVPFLPYELRRLSLTVPLVPVIGLAVASLAVVSMSTFGVELTGTSIRTLTLLLALTSLVFSAIPSVRGDADEYPQEATRRELGTLLLLGAILAFAWALYHEVIGGALLPGEDWGHYVLYADQIARQHALLINNPYWVGGNLAFAGDPGVPPLYGSFLLLSHQSPGVLVHGIAFFSMLSILSMFVLTAALWGSEAGLIAAALWAVLPGAVDVLAWSGLATIYALALLPICALCVGQVARGRLEWQWALLFVLAGVALIGAHRMTAVTGAVMLVPVLAFVLLRRGRRGAQFFAWVVAFGCVTGVGLMTHIVRLLQRTGSVSDYHAFLQRKTNWDSSVRDISWIALALGLVSLGALLAHPRTRRDPAMLVLIGLVASPIVLAYAWVVHVPLDYARMGTYLGIGLVVACGAACGCLVPRYAAIIALIPILFVARDARILAPHVRDFYQLASPATLRGIALLNVEAKSSTAPIVTDQCWAFLVPWLSHHRTMAGLEPWTIPFRQDVEPARQARRILYGGTPGRRLAHRLGIRFVVLDPECAYWSIARPPVTIRGTPLFASKRLLVLELPNA
jgi:hypothetical protein